MNIHHITIVHKRKSVGEALQWCLELFETHVITYFTSCAIAELAAVETAILLIDVENFLSLAEAGFHPAYPVLLLYSQYNNKLVEALYVGVSSAADLSKGPEEVLQKTNLILNGQSDDTFALLKIALQSNPVAATVQVAETDYKLTLKEKEILRLMRDGIHLKLIAYNTGNTYETVRTHVKHIYKKIGVMSASEAVIKALKMKL